MSYQIKYGDKTEKIMITERSTNGYGSFLMAACAVAAACLLLYAIGVDNIRSFLIPGKDSITVEAFHAFTNDLKDGESFGEAATTFCREIIQSAEVS